MNRVILRCIHVCVYVWCVCVCMYMHMSVCDPNELFEHVELQNLKVVIVKSLFNLSRLVRLDFSLQYLANLSSSDDRILGIGSVC